MTTGNQRAASDLVPLADRVRYMQVFRVAVSSVVMLFALLAPSSVGVELPGSDCPKAAAAMAIVPTTARAIAVFQYHFMSSLLVCPAQIIASRGEEPVRRS